MAKMVALKCVTFRTIGTKGSFCLKLSCLVHNRESNSTLYSPELALLLWPYIVDWKIILPCQPVVLRIFNCTICTATLIDQERKSKTIELLYLCCKLFLCKDTHQTSQFSSNQTEGKYYTTPYTRDLTVCALVISLQIVLSIILYSQKLSEQLARQPTCCLENYYLIGSWVFFSS